MLLPIVGTFFRPAGKVILQELASGAALELVPEPDNPYDPNAVKVMVKAASLPPATTPGLEEAVEGYGLDLEVLLSSDFFLGYVAKNMTQHATPGQAVLAFDAAGKPQAAV